jgi:hypothetical protein
MRKNAEVVAKRIAEVYDAETSVVEVDGTFYVVVVGAENKVIPSMIGGIWIRRAPWP